MPIPTNGAWPPKPYQPAYTAYRDWDAWLQGSPDRLRDVFLGRGANGQSLPPSQRVHAGQYSGGLIGTLSRWLWGSPPPAGQRDGRLHVPLPADLASVSANLLFSEPPKLTHPDAAIQKRLDDLIEGGLATLLLHGQEANSALGDVYLRPVIDKEVSPNGAFPAVVHADGAIPIIRWGKLVEVTFWTCLLVDGQAHYRLLEHHEVADGKGYIRYALHMGRSDDLGDRIPFKRFTETAYLDAAPFTDGVQETGLDRLDVVRVPNAGQQRLWRSQHSLKYLGRSDFDGNEQWFDALDTTWTSWMTDLRLARSRILVPDYMLQSNGPGSGASFDAEREVFTSLTMLPNQQNGGTGITMTAFNIRHAEHKATADAIVETALRHAGLSSQTLGEEGEVAVTATEVQARERQSFTTRGNRIQTWRPAIADLIELLLIVERVHFNGPEPVKPNVEFGDSVSEAPETLARTIQLLDAANAISTETKVRTLHPDWDETQVANEVKAIKDDAKAINVEEPGGEFGPPAGPPSTDDTAEPVEE